MDFVAGAICGSIFSFSVMLIRHYNSIHVMKMKLSELCTHILPSKSNGNNMNDNYTNLSSSPPRKNDIYSLYRPPTPLPKNQQENEPHSSPESFINSPIIPRPQLTTSSTVVFFSLDDTDDSQLNTFSAPSSSRMLQFDGKE